jgi:hypothetical protein
MGEGEALKGVHDARAYPYPLMTMEQERTEIPQLGRWHPDRWKTILGQQVQQERGVSPIVLLSARFGLSNLRGMTHMAGDPQFCHQTQKPPH